MEVFTRYPQHPTNRPLMANRDVAICFNRFCDNMTEFPVGQEKCPSCKRPLSKTISGSALFELLDQSGE